MFINGKKADEGRLEKTFPGQFGTDARARSGLPANQHVVAGKRVKLIQQNDSSFCCGCIHFFMWMQTISLSLRT